MRFVNYCIPFLFTICTVSQLFLESGLYILTLELEIYRCKMLVPTLVVSGQHDEFIVGMNIILHNEHILLSSTCINVATKHKQM